MATYKIADCTRYIPYPIIANHEDLTSRVIAKRKVVLPAQLLLGNSFQDEAALVKFLHPGDSSNDGDNE
jgi:hypothetical protein